MLLIDDRENEKVVNRLLMRLGDYDQDKASGRAQVRRLKSADYVIGDWGIEAKEINDLYRSILGIGRTRTVVDQLNDLHDNFDCPMLVVYGTQLKPYVHGRKLDKRAMAIEISRMKKTIKHFKSTFYNRFPEIRYMEFATKEEFIDFLVNSHTQKQINSSAYKQHKFRRVKKVDNRVATLATVRGITIEIAEDILKEFGSLPNLLKKKTTQKQLMEISGMTRDKAKAVLALREDYV